jgi:sterol desaturase/sphingolipid hydroxylase (fatty acid hydroxylase superfamily)
VSRRFVARRSSPLDHTVDALIVAVALCFVVTDAGRDAVEAMRARWSTAELVLGVGFCWYLVVFWSLGLVSLWLDARRPAWAERWRLQPRGHDDDGTADVPPARAVRRVLVNQFAGTLPALGLVSPALAWRGLSSSVTPSALDVVAHLLLAFLWVEVTFYAVHRVLHRRWWYRRVHRVHHEYRRPTGIATHHVHFVEHVAGNLVPVVGGVVVAGVHPVPLFLFITLAVKNAIVTHSDFAFPLLGDVVHHDRHHHTLAGNFGALGLLDRLFGTSLSSTADSG